MAIIRFYNPGCRPLLRPVPDCENLAVSLVWSRHLSILWGVANVVFLLVLVNGRFLQDHDGKDGTFGCFSITATVCSLLGLRHAAEPLSPILNPWNIPRVASDRL